MFFFQAVLVGEGGGGEVLGRREGVPFYFSLFNPFQAKQLLHAFPLDTRLKDGCEYIIIP